ncbi:MAG: TAXI family TRAP transporter solute-binding subunit [Oscillospiraceae bacterium]|nr:TAXI family TRAP transporter solute-binding subunit [Oscillospiraceae bacterium]
MLKLKKMLATAAALAIALSLLSGCGSGAPGSSDSASGGLVRSVNIATQAVGTSYYTMGTGIAKIITDKTPIQATILPYAGPDAWMPEFNDGTITLEVISSMDMYWAYTGTVNYTSPSEDTRLLLSGNWSNHCTMTVLESSGITSIKDLVGKRVGYEYGGNKLTVNLIDAALASVGLTIDDCVAVPLADLSSAQRALQERRVDCIFTGSSTTPSSVQLDESIGIRVLPLGDLTPEDIAGGVPESVQSVLDRYVPGATALVCPASGTVKEDTVLTSYPIQMGVSAKLSENDVYTIMKAIYENYEQLADVHAWGADWTPENYVVENFQVPYHDGAVKFYKEAGLWTDAAEATQAALLK